MADLEHGELMKKLEELLKDSAEPGKAPSVNQMIELLASADFGDHITESLQSILNLGEPDVTEVNLDDYGSGTFLGILFVLLTFGVLIFFGYKLYKSIKEKELRREEKKKAKQLKKKK